MTETSESNLITLIRRAWNEQTTENQRIRADLERSFHRDDPLEHSRLWHNVTTYCPCVAQEQRDPECPHHGREWALEVSPV